MNLAETIAQLGGPAVEQVAKQFGLPTSVTSQAVGMLLPSLSNGIANNTKKEGGLASFLGALTSGNHAQYIEQPESLAASSTTEDGNNILGHLLGGKDASRAVASTVAGVLGIENDTVKKMLPVVAALAMGGLAKQTKSAGLSEENASGSGPSDILGQLAGMIDVKDAASILGKLF